MPVPELHPVNKTPPAGSTSAVATQAVVARLIDQIKDLERRVAMLERR